MLSKLLCVVLLSLLLSLATYASHFRFGHLTWTRTTDLSRYTARFVLNAAFRRSGYSGTAPDRLPAVGNIITETVGATTLRFSDGTGFAGTLKFRVTAIFPNDDYLVGIAVDAAENPYIDKTFSGPGPYTAYIDSCCRIGSLQNSANGQYRVETTVDFAKVGASPVSSLPAITVQNLYASPTATLPIPATTSNPNAKLYYRLATNAEYGGLSAKPCIGGTSGSCLSINSDTGVITWNTANAVIGGLYSTQIVVEERDASTNTIRTKVAIDFIIRIISCSAANPTWANSAPCGSKFTLQVNTATALTVKAAVASGSVILNTASLPVGAIMSPALPATGTLTAESTLSWTPNIVGSYVINYIAQNSCGAQVTCAYSYDVRACPQTTATANPPNICFGESSVLTASAGTAYLWSNGARTQSITVNPTADTVYYVDITTSTLCTSRTFVSVTYRPRASPVVSSAAPAFCSGSTTTISSTSVGTNTQYSWSGPGIVGSTTGQSITVNEGGQYCVYTYSDTACGATVCTSVTENPTPSSVISASKTSFCAGDAVTLTAPAGASYSWSTGATSQSISVANGGVFSVTATLGSCSSTSSITLTKNALPSPTISSSLANFCEGANPTLTAQPAGLSYLWSTGATSQQIVISSSGTYTVTVTDAKGCKNTATASETSRALPVVTLTTADADICAGQSTTLVAGPTGLSYRWTGPSGALAPTTSTVSVSQTGTYTVTVTDSYSCSSSKSIAITSHALPVATITSSAASTGNQFCSGSSVTLTAGAVQGASYRWSNGATTQSITVSQSGTYSVTVTSEFGCSSTSSQVTVTQVITPAVSISASASEFCTGNSVTLTAASSAGAAYKWNTNQATQSISVTQGGTYSVQASLTYTSLVCSSSASFVVTQNALPVVSASASANSFCSGDQVTLTASPAGLTYLWSNGQTTQQTSVSTQGTYTVTATNAKGCSAQATLSITEKPVPTGVTIVTGGAPFCSDAPATLTAKPDGLSYLWSTGQTTQTITIEDSGSFTVTATNQQGCSASYTIHEEEHSIPLVSLTAEIQDSPDGATHHHTESDFCAGQTVILTAGPSNNTSFLWSTGATTQSITTTVGGTYTVIVRDATGCDDQKSVSLIRHELPVVTLSSTSNEFCDGSSLTIQSQVSGSGTYSYLWSNGATTPSITVTEGGVYTLQVTDGFHCVKTAQFTAVKRSLPTPSIVASSSEFCDKESVTLTASDSTSYTWTSGSLAGPLTTKSISVTQGGVYTVTVKNQYGCAAQTQVSVQKNPLPVVAISASGLEFCNQSSVSLQASSNIVGTSFLWNTQESTDAITVGDNGVIGATTYSVVGTSPKGCKASASVAIIERPLPDATLVSSAAEFCQTSNVVLTAGPAGNTFTWNFTTATDSSITVTSGGSYAVKVTNQYGCSVTKTIRVQENPLPVFSIDAGVSSFCHGEATVLSVSPAQYASYAWSTGSDESHINVGTGGVYSVTVTSSKGCSATKTKTIVEFPLPKPRIIASALAFCDGASVSLEAICSEDPDNHLSFIWTTGAETSAITVSDGGVYGVVATNDQGCKNATSITIVKNALPPVALTSSAAEFCTGNQVTLSASPAGLTYTWSVDGETAQEIQVSQGGQYSVTGTNPQTGCSASASIAVAQNPLPVVSIAASTFEYCNTSTVTLSASANIVGTNFVWSTNAETDTIVVGDDGDNLIGVTAYSVVGTTPKGCKASAQVDITERPLPEGTLVASAPEFCSTGSVVLTAGPAGSTFVWSHTNSTDASVTVTSGGQYFVKISNEFGCSVFKSITIIENPLPVVSVSAAAEEFCNGTTVAIQATSDITGSTFLWSTQETTDAIVVGDTGIVGATTYTVVATSPKGCSASASVAVVENPLPVLTIAASSYEFCNQSTASLEVSSDIEGTAFEWSTTETTASITVGDNGVIGATTYSVIGTSPKGCKTRSSVDIVERPLPDATLETSAPEFCSSSSVVLTAGPEGSRFAWSTGSSDSSITVTVGGSYGVNVQNQYGCSVYKSISIGENPLPVVAISPSALEFCNLTTVTLQASSDVSGSTFLWSTQEATDAIVVGDTGVVGPTTYSVVATTPKGCQASASVAIAENPLPVISLSSSAREFCHTQGSVSIQVSNDIEGSAIQWSTGATTDSIVVTSNGAVGPATYSVVVTSPKGCKSSSSLEIIERPLPAATLETSAPEFCSSSNVVLTAGPQDSTFAWSHTNASDASVVVTVGGLYSVNVQNQYGCSVVKTITVIENPLPVTVITPSATEFCESSSVTLGASASNVNIQSYSWNTNEASSNIVVRQGGLYSVTITSDKGCVSSASSNIVEWPLPIPSINSTANEFCSGQFVSLNAHPDSMADYTWSTGETTQEIIVTTGDVYSVRTTTVHGCSASTSKTIVEHANPTLTLTSSAAEFCTNQQVTISAASNDATSQFTWSTGETGAQITISAGGVYSAVAKNQHTCNTQSSIEVIEHPLPATAILASELEFCSEYESVVLTAEPADAASFLWSTGETTRQITVTTGGNYTVTATTVHGCQQSSTIYVRENPTPQPSISASAMAFCTGKSVSLTASPSGNFHYEWSNGAMARSVTITRGGNYQVTVHSDKDCKKSTSITITENPNPVVLATASKSRVFYGSPDATCTNLTCTVSANGTPGPLTYTWTATGGAVVASSEKVTVCPSVATTYTCTVSNGNTCTSSASVPIQVSDVHCGNNGDKVVMCNTQSQKTSCVSQAAVQALIKNEKYTYGTCPGYIY